VVEAQQLFYYVPQQQGLLRYQVPSGGVAYALSPYQTASHPALLPTSTVPVAPAKPAGGLDPAFLNTPAAQLVDTAIVSLNQQLPAINKFFATVGTNKLLTKLLNSAQSRSTCTVDPLTLGSLANQFIATMSQSRTELTAIVESVQKMVRAGAADDAPGAVRATTGIIDAIEPLGTKVKAVFPACAPAVLPAIAGYSGVPVRPAAVPVDAAQAADQLRDVARTLTALSSTSLIRAEADRANLNKLATIVDTIGTALARFSWRSLGPVCADNVLTPEVFKAVAETINDVSAVVGSDTAAAAKLQEVVELIKDGVKLIEDLNDPASNLVLSATRAGCQPASLKDVSRSINEIAELTAIAKS